MMKTTLSLLLVSVSLFAAQACAPRLSILLTPDPNSINTTAAQTLAAALTQSSQPGIPVTGRETQVINFTP